MALIDDLKKEVWDIYVESWDVQRAQVVPGPDDLRLTNHAKEFDGVTVLYADLDGSTSMVDNHGWQLCAEVYKAYLRCAARIVNDEDGTITAYDGDRIMAVFVGKAKNTSAVRAALKLNYVVREVLNPLFARLYKHLAFPIRHSVGIDTSEMRAARIGVRGSNDLVWVGRAANHAAKMAAIDGQPIWIAGEVYGNMHESVKFDKNGVDVWEAYTWNPMDKRLIYGTSGWYVFQEGKPDFTPARSDLPGRSWATARNFAISHAAEPRFPAFDLNRRTNDPVVPPDTTEGTRPDEGTVTETLIPVGTGRVHRLVSVVAAGQALDRE